MLSSIPDSSSEETKYVNVYDLGAGDGRLGLLAEKSLNNQVDHTYLVENDERRRTELDKLLPRENITVLFENYFSYDFYSAHSGLASLVVSNPDFHIVMQTMCIAAMLLKLSGYFLVLSPAHLLAKKSEKRWSFIKRLGFSHIKTDILGFLPFDGTGRSIKTNIAWFLFVKTSEGSPRIELKNFAIPLEEFQARATVLWRQAFTYARTKIYRELLFIEVYEMFRSNLDMILVTEEQFLHLTMQFVYPDIFFLGSGLDKEMSLWQDHLVKVLPFLGEVSFEKLQPIDDKRMKSYRVQYLALLKIVMKIPGEKWKVFKESVDVPSIRSLYEFGEILLGLADHLPSLKNPYRPPRSSKKRERETEPILDSEKLHLIELINEDAFEELFKFLKKKGFK